MPTPTPTQQAVVGMLDHRYGENRPIMDLLDDLVGVPDPNEYLSTNEREDLISNMHSPASYYTEYIDGKLVGFLNDGRTILYDDDGDGHFDGMGTVSLDGNLYWFGEHGWEVDSSPATTLIP